MNVTRHLGFFEQKGRVKVVEIKRRSCSAHLHLLDYDNEEAPGWWVSRENVCFSLDDSETNDNRFALIDCHTRPTEKVCNFFVFNDTSEKKSQICFGQNVKENNKISHLLCQLLYHFIHAWLLNENESHFFPFSNWKLSRRNDALCHDLITTGP